MVVPPFLCLCATSIGEVVTKCSIYIIIESDIYFIKAIFAWVNRGRMISKKRLYKILQSLFDFTINAVVVIALAWFCVYGFGNRSKVFGQSMQSMILSGETVLIDKISYRLVKPSRFDVILFRVEDGRDNIKRIIAIPGETVQIKDGLVYVNDKILGGRYKEANYSGLATQSIFLGADEYFVLGDNRDSSEDSRFESIGNIKRDEIVGKVWARIDPLLRIGIVR